MKVLVVTTSYPDYEGSTRGIFIRRLCRELVSQGAEIVVLTPRILGQSPLFEVEPGIRVHRFRYPSGNTPLNQHASIPVLPMCLYMLSGLAKALALIWKEKPDVIHGNWIVPTGLIAALAGLVTGTPVMNTARGMDMRVSETGVVRKLFDLAVRLSGKVTVVSEAMKKRAVLKDAEVIPSGVDPSFFSPGARREEGAVLHVRALEPVYDVQTLIRAVPFVVGRSPGARFIIAGSGSQEEALKNMSAELGILDKVSFLGTVSNAEIASLMQHAAVYVSTAVADGTSIALLEAMSSGLVPVVTDIEPNRAFITQGKDGYLFRTQDPEDLGDKILRAFSGEVSQETLEKKRALMQETIFWGRIAGRVMDGYRQLLGPAGAKQD